MTMQGLQSAIQQGLLVTRPPVILTANYTTKQKLKFLPQIKQALCVN